MLAFSAQPHPYACVYARTNAPRHAIGRAVAFLVATLTLSVHAATALPTITVADQAQPSGYAAQRSSTATKTEVPLLDTPQSVSVVTQAQMKDRAVQSLAEVATYVPGVSFAQGEGNRETPIFRGISSTGDFFIDGIRDDVQYYRDLYNIERVEIFTGPNAMIFGRGATGGSINRATKQAHWLPASASAPALDSSVTLGANSNRRATLDFNRPINDQWAFRINALHEDSGSYRDGVSIKRSGINPTLSWRAGVHTLVTLGYEYFKDDRIGDRGVSSYRGAPVASAPSTFFGNADASPNGTTLHALSALVEHEFDNGVLLRNRTRFSDQDKFYQNVFPGAVTADGTGVALVAYNHATSRKSFFNQTDLNYTLHTGAVKHKLLLGAELGQQDTEGLRQTGYFPGDKTSITVGINNPTTQLPVVFRQSATDADNGSTAKTTALYMQDQVELNSHWHLVGGLRYDRFTVDFTNHRNGQNLKTADDLLSPRLGIIYKPQPTVSLYANYSVAYQPRAGDQLASLTVTNAVLAPEKFKNFEVGAKWDIARNLSATAALYHLNRSNVITLDPTDPTGTRTMLSDGQRSQGVELGLSGNLTPAWSVAAGYTYADAKFTAHTSATLHAGNAVGQVPKHTLAVWNRYNVNATWGAGVGVIHRSKMFAANELIATSAAPLPNVVLPGYTRVDAALYYALSPTMQLQLNVENLFDKKYYLNANSNNNITPGSPRAVRVTLNAKF